MVKVKIMRKGKSGNYPTPLEGQLYKIAGQNRFYIGAKNSAGYLVYKSVPCSDLPWGCKGGPDLPDRRRLRKRRGSRDKEMLELMKLLELGVADGRPARKRVSPEQAAREKNLKIKEALIDAHHNNVNPAFCKYLPQTSCSRQPSCRWDQSAKLGHGACKAGRADGQQVQGPLNAPQWPMADQQQMFNVYRNAVPAFQPLFLSSSAERKTRSSDISVLLPFLAMMIGRQGSSVGLSTDAAERVGAAVATAVGLGVAQGMSIDELRIIAANAVRTIIKNLGVAEKRGDSISEQNDLITKLTGQALDPHSAGIYSENIPSLSAIPAVSKLSGMWESLRFIKNKGTAPQMRAVHAMNRYRHIDAEMKERIKYANEEAKAAADQIRESIEKQLGVIRAMPEKTELQRVTKEYKKNRKENELKKAIAFQERVKKLADILNNNFNRKQGDGQGKNNKGKNKGNNKGNDGNKKHELRFKFHTPDAKLSGVGNGNKGKGKKGKKGNQQGNQQGRRDGGQQGNQGGRRDGGNQQGRRDGGQQGNQDGRRNNNQQGRNRKTRRGGRGHKRR